MEQPQSAAAPAPKKSNTLTIVVIVGVILAVVSVPCCGIFAALLLPALVRAKQRAQEVKARQRLEMIQVGQETFRRDDPDKNGKNDYAANLKQLVDLGLVSGELSSGSEGGYRYEVHLGADPLAQWWGTAQPVDGSPGMLYFYVDETAIRTEKGQPANAKSPIWKRGE